MLQPNDSLIELPNGDFYVPANPKMLEITLLYLSKYEALEQIDRNMFREIIMGFATGRDKVFIRGKDAKLE